MVFLPEAPAFQIATFVQLPFVQSVASTSFRVVAFRPTTSYRPTRARRWTVSSAMGRALAAFGTACVAPTGLRWARDAIRPTLVDEVSIYLNFLT